jgi:hypothetical protein
VFRSVFVRITPFIFIVLNKYLKEYTMIYAYIRVSTDKQTIENQRFEIGRYCEANNLKIGKWIEECISGKKSVNERKL